MLESEFINLKTVSKHIEIICQYYIKLFNKLPTFVKVMDTFPTFQIKTVLAENLSINFNNC